MVWRDHVEIDYADREKLFEGLIIMAKIIAREVAKGIVSQQVKQTMPFQRKNLHFLVLTLLNC